MKVFSSLDNFHQYICDKPLSFFDERFMVHHIHLWTIDIFAESKKQEFLSAIIQMDKFCKLKQLYDYLHKQRKNMWIPAEFNSNNQLIKVDENLTFDEFTQTFQIPTEVEMKSKCDYIYHIELLSQKYLEELAYTS